MKYTKNNINGVNISLLPHFKIRISDKSKRRGSNKDFLGRPNCSGYNINMKVFDGMTVEQYQKMIKRDYDSSDPQFSLTKHLRYDILKVHYELEE